jgi:pilus assembly protein CpaB
LKSRIALLVAIALGFLAALAVRQHISKKEIEIYQGKAPVPIVIAKREIQAGEEVKGAAIAVKTLQEEAITSRHVSWDERHRIIGKKVNDDIRAGDPIEWPYLQSQEQAEEGLQGGLRIGERAVTISVNRISGVGGMIRPGDWIDLYATFRKRDDNADMGFRKETYPLLRSVQVMATDQDIRPQDIPPAMRRAGGGKEGYTSLTLRVSPKEAASIIHATSDGGAVLTALLKNRKYLEEAEAPPNISSDNFIDKLKEIEAARQVKLKKQFEESQIDPE